MEKILLTIEAPSVGQKFDILAPPYMTMEQLRTLLYPVLEELTNGAYSPSGKEILCRREDQKILPLDIEMNRLDVQVGDHLILF